MDGVVEPEGTEPAPALEGLSGVRFVSLERVPIRMRESGATLSAWRLAAAADRGEGAIVAVEGAEAGHWRGEGVFLGWSAEKLAAAYAALLPAKDDEPPFELNQLG